MSLAMTLVMILVIILVIVILLLYRYALINSSIRDYLVVNSLMMVLLRQVNSMLFLLSSSNIFVLHVAKINRDVEQIRMLNSKKTYISADDCHTQGCNSYHSIQYDHTFSKLALVCCTNLPSCCKNYPDVFNDDRDFKKTFKFSALEQKGLFQCA